MKTKPYCSIPLLSATWFMALAPLWCAAAPPELVIVQQQYEKAVLGPHAAGIADLDAKFTTALTNAVTAAKQAGHLDDVLAIQADQKRLAEKLPIPDADGAEIPETLKKLRGIYRDQLGRLEAQRVANHAALMPDYTGKLKDLEIYLTKADRIADATEVKAYRESLAAGVVAVASPATAKPARSASMKSSSAPPVDPGPKVSPEEASRQLAEWAVQNGHSATVVGKKGSVVIKTAQDIPKEKFDLIKLERVGIAGTPPPWRLFQFTPNVDYIAIGMHNHPFKPADMAMLHKLSTLKFLEIRSKVEDVSSVVRAMPEFPSLTELIFDYPINGDDLSQLVRKYPTLLRPWITADESLSDSEFAVVSGWKKATSMMFNYIKAPLTQAKADVLAKMPALTTLVFYSPTSILLELPVAGSLPKITSVWIHYTLPTKALDGICALPALDYLYLSKIQDLDDAALAPLAAATKLKSLDLGGATKLTDAALDHLKGLKKLESLNLKDTRISDAAITAFKEERSDVTVEK